MYFPLILDCGRRQKAILKRNRSFSHGEIKWLGVMTINGLRWTPIICMTGCLWVLESWDSSPWFVASSGFVIKSARQLLLSLDEAREHWKFTPRITLVVTQLLKLFYTSYTCTILDGAKVSWVWHYPLSDLLVGTKLQGVDWCLQLSTGDIMQLCSVFKTKGPGSPDPVSVMPSLIYTVSKKGNSCFAFPPGTCKSCDKSVSLHSSPHGVSTPVYPVLPCAPSGHLQLKKK